MLFCSIIATILKLRGKVKPSEQAHAVFHGIAGRRCSQSPCSCAGAIKYSAHDLSK